MPRQRPNGDRMEHHKGQSPDWPLGVRASHSVLGGTEIETKQKGFNESQINNIPVNNQAAHFVATRYHLPMPTAAVVSVLAGLGGRENG